MQDALLSPEESSVECEKKESKRYQNLTKMVALFRRIGP
jgi:hypothetical protein